MKRIVLHSTLLPQTIKGVGGEVEGRGPGGREGGGGKSGRRGREGERAREREGEGREDAYNV